MNFAEKLKSLRKEFGMSQEQLAEKIGVSRQAITKWETDGGMPDIENILTLASLFKISLDDLLSAEKDINRLQDFFYESVTEYDIDAEKHYDIKLGSAYETVIYATESEKLKVRLCSNVLPTLEQSFKVKIDDNKNNIDVGVNCMTDVSKLQAKDALFIFIGLPQKYISGVEVFVHTGTLRLSGIQVKILEFEGRAGTVYLNNVEGMVELDCSSDLDIICGGLIGGVGINQISATSILHIPKGTAYAVKKKGGSNRISYTLNGKAAEQPLFENADDTSNIIKFSGLNSELTIDEYTEYTF